MKNENLKSQLNKSLDIDNVNLTLFNEIKKITDGYLAPESYKELYLLAFNAPKGVVVDIGPAQGGSTISLALGRKKAGKLSKIYSIDTFCHSEALKSMNSIEDNVNTLRTNLRHFSINENVDILIAGTDNIKEKTMGNEPIAVLFIDADGALDRDFNLFYNRLCPGAIIILDDYQRFFNRQTRLQSLKCNNQNEINDFLEFMKVKTVTELCPLGKQYSTYNFIQYFIKMGFLEQIKIIDDTFFARKPDNAPVFNTEKTKSDLLSIRRDLEEEFYYRRCKMQNYYEIISKYLPFWGEATDSDYLFFFENDYDEFFDKLFTFKACEWHKDNLKDSLEFKNIPLDNIKNIADKLIENISINCLVSDIKDEKIKKFFTYNNILSVFIHPIFVDNSFYGFLVFCECKNNRKWSDEEAFILKIFSNSFSMALSNLYQMKKFIETPCNSKFELYNNMPLVVEPYSSWKMSCIDLLSNNNLTTRKKGFINEKSSIANILLNIIDSVFYSSLYNAGKIIINENRFNLREFINEMLANIKSYIFKKSIKINLFVEQEVPAIISGDISYFKYVFYNLLNNAINFTQIGSIDLNVKVLNENDAGAFLQFEIKDTGIGFSNEHKEQINLLFKNIDQSNIIELNGFGLGLLLSAKIINDLKGSIWLKSELNKGSSFFFTMFFKKIR